MTNALGPGTAVGLERVRVGPQAENQYAIGPLVPAGDQVVSAAVGRIDPGGVLAPACRIAAEQKLVRPGIAIRHRHPEKRRGQPTDGLDLKPCPRILVGIDERREKRVEPCPAALGHGGSIDLGRDPQIPRGRGCLEATQRVVGQVVVAPGHSQAARLEIEQRPVAGIGPADRDPMGRREGIAEIDPRSRVGTQCQERRLKSQDTQHDPLSHTFCAGHDQSPSMKKF